MEKDKKKKKKIPKRRVYFLAFLIVLTANVGVWAWFTISNRARVENLSLIADHQGNLQIADDLGNGPGTYSDALNLNNATGTKMSSIVLSPVTSRDGVNFYIPNFDSLTNTVNSVTQLTDRAQLTKYYIYEKTFYLKAGSNSKNNVAEIKRTYDVALYGVQSNNRTNGCFIYQPASSGDTAANAIRISFTLPDGQTYVYEPNCNKHNNDTNRAINGIGSEYGSYANLYQQNADGTFVKSPKANESEKLFTLDENKDTLVTMRVWIEGTDNDCTNSIASDMIAGQIQFISTEKKN